MQDNRNPCAEGSYLATSSIPIAGFIMIRKLYRHVVPLHVQQSGFAPFLQLSAGYHLSFHYINELSHLFSRKQYGQWPTHKHNPVQALAAACAAVSSIFFCTLRWEKWSTESFEGHTVHKLLKHRYHWLHVAHDSWLSEKHSLWSGWIDTSVQWVTWGVAKSPTNCVGGTASWGGDVHFFWEPFFWGGESHSSVSVCT